MLLTYLATRQNSLTDVEWLSYYQWLDQCNQQITTVSTVSFMSVLCAISTLSNLSVTINPPPNHPTTQPPNIGEICFQQLSSCPSASQFNISVPVWVHQPCSSLQGSSKLFSIITYDNNSNHISFCFVLPFLLPLSHCIKMVQFIYCELKKQQPTALMHGAHTLLAILNALCTLV